MAEPGRHFLLNRAGVISPNNFAGAGRLSATLLAFTDRYNKTARPFYWKYTAADLAGLLDRISAHDQPAQEPDRLPEAA